MGGDLARDRGGAEPAGDGDAVVAESLHAGRAVAAAGLALLNEINRFVVDLFTFQEERVVYLGVSLHGGGLAGDHEVGLGHGVPADLALAGLAPVM